MVSVLVVPPSLDEAPTVREVLISHSALCELVSDVSTDTVFFADGSGMARVGSASRGDARRSLNTRATQLLERLLPGFASHDAIYGTAIFLGLDDESDPDDVPARVLTLADGLFGRAINCQSE